MIGFEYIFEDHPKVNLHIYVNLILFESSNVTQVLICKFVSCFAASTNLFSLGNSMINFNGLNFAEWSEQIHFYLGVMYLDVVIMSDEIPNAITETSTEDEKYLYEA